MPVMEVHKLLTSRLKAKLMTCQWWLSMTEIPVDLVLSVPLHQASAITESELLAESVIRTQLPTKPTCLIWSTSVKHQMPTQISSRWWWQLNSSIQEETMAWWWVVVIVETVRYRRRLQKLSWGNREHLEVQVTQFIRATEATLEEVRLNTRTHSTKLLPTSSIRLGSIIILEAITLESNPSIAIWVALKVTTILWTLVTSPLWALVVV